MPVNDVVNPFLNAPLRIPTRDWPLVEKFTTTQQAQADPDKAPFRRYVDLWWAGLCIGMREGRRTELPPNEWHRFNDGTPLSADPWRIIHLQLLAVGLTGDATILDDPGAIVQMANEYCATGLPMLLEAMNRSTEPIMVASEFLRERCVVPETAGAGQDQA
jgi:hypothetical protein